MSTIPHERRPKGKASAIVSCFFACLSLILFAFSSVSAYQSHHMADMLEKQADAAGIPHTNRIPQTFPAFDWDLYRKLATQGRICWSAGMIGMIVALISGHIGFFQAKRARNPFARRLAATGLILGYFSLLPAGVSSWLEFVNFFDFFLWGVSF